MVTTVGRDDKLEKILGIYSISDMTKTMETEEAKRTQRNFRNLPNQRNDRRRRPMDIPLRYADDDSQEERFGAQERRSKNLFQETKITTKDFKIGVPMLNGKKV